MISAYILQAITIVLEIVKVNIFLRPEEAMWETGKASLLMKCFSVSWENWTWFNLKNITFMFTIFVPLF